jgi:hypothetical protein
MTGRRQENEPRFVDRIVRHDLRTQFLPVALGHLVIEQGNLERLTFGSGPTHQSQCLCCRAGPLQATVMRLPLSIPRQRRELH